MSRGTADAEIDPHPAPTPHPRPSPPSSAENPSLPMECPRVRDSNTVRCLYSVLGALAWLCCASSLTPAARKPRDALAWCHAMYTFTGIRLSPAMISCLHSMSTIPPTTHPQQWRLMNPPKTACACGCFCGGAIVNGHTRSPLRVQALSESRGGRPGPPSLISLMDVKQH